MPERLEHVEVLTAFGPVTLTWEARDRLLDELRHLDSLADVVADFVNAGASRPVRIPEGERLAVASVIEMMGQQSRGGLVGLQGGLFELRNALVDQPGGNPQ